MRNHRRIKLVIAILAVLIVATILTPSLLAVASSSYQFEPSPNYTQSDTKAILRIFAGSGGTFAPARVVWVNPQGTTVSYCNTGSCGVSYDQLVGDNSILIWRAFYFYISGQQRSSGTYTAIAYSYQGSGVYTELFRANFYISGTPITPTPTPTPNPIGTLDPTFGIEGIVTTDFCQGAFGNAIAIQADGKIVAAGTGLGCGYFFLARYNSNGSLDTGFGTGGKVTTSIGDSIAIQDDGKIVVAGDSESDFALARYNSDGSLDTGFGSGGKVTTDFGDGGVYWLNTVAIQADGKIVVAGSTSISSGPDNFALARYNSDGSLDTGFGTGGKVTTSFGDNAVGRSVVVQDDGKIVVAGTHYKYSSVLGTYNRDFALARYNSDGYLDTGFGVGGQVNSDLSGEDSGYAAALQKDGKIVVVGITYKSLGSYHIALARYNSDGSLDTGSGTTGKVTTDWGEGYAVAVQDDGKIVVAGSDSGFTVWRYVLKSTIFQVYLPFITK